MKGDATVSPSRLGEGMLNGAVVSFKQALPQPLPYTGGEKI